MSPLARNLCRRHATPPTGLLGGRVQAQTETDRRAAPARRSHLSPPTLPPPVSFPPMTALDNGRRRVAVVAGVRTPFARAGSALKNYTAIELGKLCVAELLQRANLTGTEVDAVVYGTVVPNVIAPNIAREVSLMPMLPKGT